MADAAPTRSATGTSKSGGATAIWVLVVQCLLALSWTLYVLFLPAMLSAAGIERRWFVYVLIVDQLIFAACDWTAGVYADRIAPLWKRTGRAITAVTLLSSAMLLVMPWVAKHGNAVFLLVVIFTWAATSSALRAPVFALLGRVREAAGRDASDLHPAIIGRAGTISVALVGVSLAGAVGPYVTMLLKAVDPRLPIAVSAVSLAVAGLWATRVEETMPHAAADPGAANAVVARRRAWALAAIVLVAAFGTQVVTAIVVQPLFHRFVGNDAILWTALFWVGFAIGLMPGTRIAAAGAASGISGGTSLHRAAVALLFASIVFAVGATSDSLTILAIGVTLTGAAWGLFTTVAFTSAVSLSGGRATTSGAGTASGMLFSALAVGSLLRLAIVAAGWTRADLVAWLPEIAWVTASVLLVVAVALLWRAPAADPSASAT